MLVKLLCVITFIAALSLLPNPAAAQCSRDDIDYYLSKGFSQEQVAAICSGAGAKPRYQAHGEQEREFEAEQYSRRQDEDDRLFLRTAINGWDIVLTPEVLEYTRKFCLSVGKTPEVEGRTRICPDVRYRIHFAGLQIRNAERKYYFIGQREVNVIGRVGRKLLHDFKEYPEDLAHDLIRKYKATIRKDGTHIPVRKDVPLNRVVGLLQEYAGRASRL